MKTLFLYENQQMMPLPAETPLLLSPTKQALIELVKRRGDIGLEDAAAATTLARSTIREHLLHMERDGWVRRFFNRQERGRPTIRYVLTDQGHRLFPAREGVLLRELIAYLQENDQHRLLESFFEGYWSKRLIEVRELLGPVMEAGPREKAESLKTILDEQGFMPEYVIDGGTVEFRECNCPFTEVMKSTRIPCRLEARFFEQLWNTRLERVSYIPDGASACIYRFQA